LFQEGAIRAFGEAGEGVALKCDYDSEEASWEWVNKQEKSEE
jgi:hypothetical protein